MLGLPSKACAKDVAWGAVLHKHIARAYSNSLADDHSSQCDAINDALTNVAGSISLSSEQAREAHKRYYRLLGALEMRFDSAECARHPVHGDHSVARRHCSR